MRYQAALHSESLAAYRVLGSAAQPLKDENGTNGRHSVGTLSTARTVTIAPASDRRTAPGQQGFPGKLLKLIDGRKFFDRARSSRWPP
ncbi:hypothetical protein MES4922_390026 [Mesorhizobium ventifaucium]|uniref:Uncharacterized protein n=1 Tax=Mesorhizobium ventifaucium TaxID=666020 RepID=A0ABN8K8N4_9HYPH|nr:hypothetical protein MES4922_390026 [Mesorhizobium ventifaucium]